MRKRKNLPPPDDKQLSLLGKPFDLVVSLLGEPVGEYPHRGQRVVMFQRKDETITCELAGDVVQSINSFKDRRSAARIRPTHPKQAFLRHSDCRHAATIIDLSVKSVAMKLEEGCLPKKGEFVTFCTSLRTRARTKVYVALAGHVHSVSPAEQKVVILLHMPFETQSHRALQDYINVQQALLSVGAAAFYHQHCGDDASEHDVIKSDLCVLCEEGACGVGNAPYRDKNLPRHLGING